LHALCAKATHLSFISFKKRNRYYPIIDEIPHMLPDELRERDEDLKFLKTWENKVPRKILDDGKPFNFKK
jgi:hypothetical protein